MTAAAGYSADEAYLLGYKDDAVRYSMQTEALAAGLDANEVTDASEALTGIENLKTAS
jgi:hypothetical protein